eukprot:g633.t1
MVQTNLVNPHCRDIRFSRQFQFLCMESTEFIFGSAENVREAQDISLMLITMWVLLFILYGIHNLWVTRYSMRKQKLSRRIGIYLVILPFCSLYVTQDDPVLSGSLWVISFVFLGIYLILISRPLVRIESGMAYQIRCKGSSKYLHANDYMREDMPPDFSISTHVQDDNLFVNFRLLLQNDGSYKVVCMGSRRCWFANEDEDGIVYTTTEEEMQYYLEEEIQFYIENELDAEIELDQGIAEAVKEEEEEEEWIEGEEEDAGKNGIESKEESQMMQDMQALLDSAAVIEEPNSSELEAAAMRIENLHGEKDALETKAGPISEDLHQPMQDKARFFFERQQDKSFRVRVKDSGRYIRSDDDSDSFLSTRYQNRDPYCRFYLEPVYWNEEGKPESFVQRRNRRIFWTYTIFGLLPMGIVTAGMWKDFGAIFGSLILAVLTSLGFFTLSSLGLYWFITEKLMDIVPAVRTFTKGSFVLMYLIPITGAPLLYTFEIIVQLSVIAIFTWIFGLLWCILNKGMRQILKTESEERKDLKNFIFWIITSIIYVAFIALPAAGLVALYVRSIIEVEKYSIQLTPWSQMLKEHGTTAEETDKRALELRSRDPKSLSIKERSFLRERKNALDAIYNGMIDKYFRYYWIKSAFLLLGIVLPAGAVVGAYFARMTVLTEEDIYPTLIEYDACGICGGTNATCIGCDGKVGNGTHKAEYDECWVCGGNGSTCAGCDGIPNSGLLVDACGVCGGDNYTCLGCDLVPNSGKILDPCGVCNFPNDTGWGSTCLGCDGNIASGYDPPDCTGVNYDQVYHNYMRVLEGMAHIALGAMFTVVAAISSSLFVAIEFGIPGLNTDIGYVVMLGLPISFVLTTYFIGSNMQPRDKFLSLGIILIAAIPLTVAKVSPITGTRLEDDLRLVFALAGVGAVVLALSTLSIIRFYRQNLTMLVQTVCCFSILIPVLFGGPLWYSSSGNVKRVVEIATIAIAVAGFLLVWGALSWTLYRLCFSLAHAEKNLTVKSRNKSSWKELSFWAPIARWAFYFGVLASICFLEVAYFRIVPAAKRGVVIGTLSSIPMIVLVQRIPSIATKKLCHPKFVLLIGIAITSGSALAMLFGPASLYYPSLVLTLTFPSTLLVLIIIRAVRRRVRQFGKKKATNIMQIVNAICCCCFLLPFGVTVPTVVGLPWQSDRASATIFSSSIGALVLVVIIFVAISTMSINSTFNSLKREKVAKIGTARLRRNMEAISIDLSPDVGREVFDTCCTDFGRLQNEDEIHAELESRILVDFVTIVRKGGKVFHEMKDGQTFRDELQSGQLRLCKKCRKNGNNVKALKGSGGRCQNCNLKHVAEAQAKALRYRKMTPAQLARARAADEREEKEKRVKIITAFKSAGSEMKKENWKKCLEHITVAIDLNEGETSNPRHLKMRAKASLKVQDASQAVEDAEEAIAVTKNDFEAYTLYGDALDKLSRLHDAAQAYERALRIRPGSTELEEKLSSVNARIRSAAGVSIEDIINDLIRKATKLLLRLRVLALKLASTFFAKLSKSTKEYRKSSVKSLKRNGKIALRKSIQAYRFSKEIIKFAMAPPSTDMNIRDFKMVRRGVTFDEAIQAAQLVQRRWRFKEFKARPQRDKETIMLNLLFFHYGRDGLSLKEASDLCDWKAGDEIQVDTAWKTGKDEEWNDAVVKEVTMKGYIVRLVKDKRYYMAQPDAIRSKEDAYDDDGAPGADLMKQLATKGTPLKNLTRRREVMLQLLRIGARSIVDLAIDSKLDGAKGKAGPAFAEAWAWQERQKVLNYNEAREELKLEMELEKEKKLLHDAGDEIERVRLERERRNVFELDEWGNKKKIRKTKGKKKKRKDLLAGIPEQKLLAYKAFVMSLKVLGRLDNPGLGKSASLASMRHLLKNRILRYNPVWAEIKAVKDHQLSIDAERIGRKMAGMSDKAKGIILRGFGVAGDKEVYYAIKVQRRFRKWFREKSDKEFRATMLIHRAAKRFLRKRDLERKEAAERLRAMIDAGEDEEDLAEKDTLDGGGDDDAVELEEVGADEDSDSDSDASVEDDEDPEEFNTPDDKIQAILRNVDRATRRRPRWPKVAERLETTLIRLRKPKEDGDAEDEEEDVEIDWSNQGNISALIAVLQDFWLFSSIAMQTSNLLFRLPVDETGLPISPCSSRASTVNATMTGSSEMAQPFDATLCTITTIVNIPKDLGFGGLPDGFVLSFAINCILATVFPLYSLRAIQMAQAGTLGLNPDGSKLKSCSALGLYFSGLSYLSTNLYFPIVRSMLSIFACDFSSLDNIFLQADPKLTCFSLASPMQLMMMIAAVVGITCYYPLATLLQPNFQFQDKALDIKYDPAYLILYTQGELMFAGATVFFTGAESRYMLISVQVALCLSLAWLTWSMQPCLVAQVNRWRCAVFVASAGSGAGGMLFMRFGNATMSWVGMGCWWLSCFLVAAFFQLRERIAKARKERAREEAGIISTDEQDLLERRENRKRKKLLRQREKVAKHIFRSFCSPPLQIDRVAVEKLPALLEAVGLDNVESERKKVVSDDDQDLFDSDSDDSHDEEILMEKKAEMVQHEASLFLSFLKSKEVQEKATAATKIQSLFRKRSKNSPAVRLTDYHEADGEHGNMNADGDVLNGDSIVGDADPESALGSVRAAKPREAEISSPSSSSSSSSSSIYSFSEVDFVEWICKRWDERPSVQPLLPKFTSKVLSSKSRKECRAIAERVFLEFSYPPLLPDRIASSSLKPLLKKLGLRAGPKAVHAALVQLSSAAEAKNNGRVFTSPQKRYTFANQEHAVPDSAKIITLSTFLKWIPVHVADRRLELETKEEQNLQKAQAAREEELAEVAAAGRKELAGKFVHSDASLLIKDKAGKDKIACMSKSELSRELRRRGIFYGCCGPSTVLRRQRLRHICRQRVEETRSKRLAEVRKMNEKKQREFEAAISNLKKSEMLELLNEMDCPVVGPEAQSESSLRRLLQSILEEDPAQKLKFMWEYNEKNEKLLREQKEKEREARLKSSLAPPHAVTLRIEPPADESERDQIEEEFIASMAEAMGVHPNQICIHGIT